MFRGMSLALAVLVLTGAGGSVSCSAAEEFRLLPARIQLESTADQQRVLAVMEEEGLTTAQIPAFEMEWSVEPAGIARWENDRLLPVKNGEATLTARYGDRSASVPVIVSGQDEEFVWSFRNHVQSVLTKHGCNSGACHGAAAGKNGFKLSLRGYDPQFDHFAITRQARGRRIVPTDPGLSLLLTKPTGKVPHKGGALIEEGSPDYMVLAEWIAAGQPEPRESDARITELEIFPKHYRVKPGVQLQLIVRAKFSDGHDEDVTDWVKFDSHNQSVAQVKGPGRINVAGEGEGAILAWYLALNEMAIITVPQDKLLDPEKFAIDETTNRVDRHVLTKLQELGIAPAKRCSDEAFLRRVYLDTIGTLPTPDEVRAFLADQSPDKREQVIDALLERPEFVDYWAYRWSDLLLVSGRQLPGAAVTAYYKWIREQVEQDVPWDELVEKILLAKGSSLENGAVNFYGLHRDPLLLTENVSMAFLGMSMNCARCHDHPLEKWTNDDYYGMVSLFARVRAKGWGGDPRDGDGNRIVFLAPDGEVIQPRTGQPQAPQPLDEEAIGFEEFEDRRTVLADWVTSPENPYFTKAIVNRVWANFLGVGIVEAVDDLRLTNPPSNPELLDSLGEFLIENDYQLKPLMKLILTSDTYQRSSETTSDNENDQRYYSHYYPKRLRAEVLLDAVGQVTGVPTKFSQRQQSGTGLEKIEVADGTKAQQLEDTSVVSYFLDTFGRPERLATCECERSSEPSMSQVLHIMNGSTLNEKLSEKENAIQKAIDAGKSDREIIEDAYLASLGRTPKDRELEQTLSLIPEGVSPEERRVIFEDVYWSLLSSNDFLFNH